MVGTYTINDDIENLKKLLIKTFGSKGKKSNENLAHILIVLSIVNNDKKQYKNLKANKQFSSCVDSIFTLINAKQTDYLEDIVPKRLKASLKDLTTFEKLFE